MVAPHRWRREEGGGERFHARGLLLPVVTVTRLLRAHRTRHHTCLSRGAGAGRAFLLLYALSFSLKRTYSAGKAGSSSLTCVQRRSSLSTKARRVQEMHTALGELRTAEHARSHPVEFFT